MFELINSRRIGKMYHRFCQYIATIRCGEQSMMVGEGYVVMSTEHYDRIRPKSGIKFFGIDMAKGWDHPGPIIVAGSGRHPLIAFDAEDFAHEKVSAFVEPMKFRLPIRSEYPTDRQTPAKKCNYSTKFK